MTQLYDPAKGSFGAGSATARISLPASTFEAATDGPGVKTWVIPKAAGDVTGLDRLLAGVPTLSAAVEFEVPAGSLRAAGSAKQFFAPFQMQVPGEVRLNAQAMPNFTTLPSGTAELSLWGAVGGAFFGTALYAAWSRH